MANALSSLVLAALLAAPVTTRLIDHDNDGTYRICVVGDSNSADGSMGKWRTSWVEWIQKGHLLQHVRALRRGIATREPVAWSNGSVPGWSCVSPLWGTNRGQVWVGSSVHSRADAIIAAAGTNDLRGARATPEQVVGCYADMQSAARRHGVAFFVATTPPISPPYPDREAYNDRINALNALIRSTFDPRTVIDFDSGFSPALFSPGGGLHLNDAGQRLRAQRAVAVLSAVPENGVPHPPATPAGRGRP